ncbi:MAG: hypothetical protein ACE37F_17735 [Nannocystaceae bacterium]|nr:hypothetical protein [bacterium]
MAMLGALSGCPTQRPAPQAPEPDPQPPATAVLACPADAPFTTLGWTPPSAESVAVVDLRADALDETLRRLSEGAKSPDRQLPIRLAFSLGQWTWQVPLLRTTLASAGFDPAQLVHVSLPDGASAWAWPQSCDLPTLADNLATAWGMRVRSTPYGAVGLVPSDASGDEVAFAYDFIAYGASAYLLVPAGRAQAVASRLAERGSDLGAPSLGQIASELDEAPVRLVVRTGALLTPGATADAPDRVSRHRVDAQGWQTVPAGS